MTDFKNTEELLNLCDGRQQPISEIMKQRECDLTETPLTEVLQKMARALEIMRESAFAPLKTPVRSMGGLIGGQAKMLNTRLESGGSICGSVLTRGITYAMAVLEVNASMGVIVAAPTAGSSGIVPGLLLSLQESYSFSDEQMINALFNAGAIGYLAMRNATVAGAVGGCQAEVGVAAAMAASASVELMGGTPRQCLDAASTVLINMLGLVCDPVGGLVEVPCVKRNVIGAMDAMSAAQMALAGIRSRVPPDQVLDAMAEVGRSLPHTLRETGKGGLAATPFGMEYAPKD